MVAVVVMFVVNVAAKPYVRPPTRRALSFWGGCKKDSAIQQVNLGLGFFLRTLLNTFYASLSSVFHFAI